MTNIIWRLLQACTNSNTDLIKPPDALKLMLRHPPAEECDCAPLPRGMQGAILLPNPTPYAAYPYYAPHLPPLPPHYGYYGRHPTPAKHQHGNAGSGSSHGQQTSSDLKDVEDPTIFPLILTWLADMDASPHGADGQALAWYADMISNEGYYCLCELADSMTADDLKSACPGILDGVARTLLCHATTDVRRICDKAGKDCKHAKKQDQA